MLVQPFTRLLQPLKMPPDYQPCISTWKQVGMLGQTRGRLVFSRFVDCYSRRTMPDGFARQIDYLDGVNALKDLAMHKNHENWSWHGGTYIRQGNGLPHRGSLNLHWEVLFVLVRLVPGAHINPWSLRDVLVGLHLHIWEGIFDGIPRDRDNLKLKKVAKAAADRWCVMLRHCLILRCLGWVANDKINEVVARIAPREAYRQLLLQERAIPIWDYMRGQHPPRF